MENKQISLDEAAGIAYLNSENASFEKNGDFPSAVLKKDGNEDRHDRVWLHRVFPYDLKDEFISVQNKDGEELGLIRRLSDFSEKEQEILRGELERKYFTPRIMAIETLRERHGFSYWKIKSDIGEVELTVQDTYRSIMRIGEDRAVVTDISGNRYEIDSLSALDKSSRRRLELYL